MFSLPFCFDIYLTASITFAFEGTNGSISLLYGVIVIWKRYGIFILSKSFIIGIGFLVQNKIKSTSLKLILLTKLGLNGFLTSTNPSFNLFKNLFV